MPINLSKGQKISHTKDNPGLKNILVGLGWDINQFDTGTAFDLDTTAFLRSFNRSAASGGSFAITQIMLVYFPQMIDSSAVIGTIPVRVPGFNDSIFMGKQTGMTDPPLSGNALYVCWFLTGFPVFPPGFPLRSSPPQTGRSLPSGCPPWRCAERWPRLRSQ